MNYSIILAAGEGRRFGGKKQFYPIKGIPLFLYSVLAFARSPFCSKIVIVTNKNKVRFVESWVKRKRLKKVCKVVVGGKRRIDSTGSGLAELPKEGIVAIHDAVRPIVKKEIIELGFRYAKKYRAVVFGIPVEDTIKRVQDLRVVETLQRENIYRIQTPQFFEISLLREAWRAANERGEDCNDESQLVERAGFPPYLFLGDKYNIKVTTREDIPLVKLLLK